MRISAFCAKRNCDFFCEFENTVAIRSVCSDCHIQNHIVVSERNECVLAELCAIFDMNMSKYDYQMEEDVHKQIREMLKMRKLTELENFANAREVRNLFEEIITNQAHRIASMKDLKPEDMKTIIMDDLIDLELQNEIPESNTVNEGKEA